MKLRTFLHSLSFTSLIFSLAAVFAVIFSPVYAKTEANSSSAQQVAVTNPAQAVQQIFRQDENNTSKKVTETAEHGQGAAAVAP